MTLKLSTRTQRRILKSVRAGRYESPEKVVEAALAALDHADSFGDFAPGELDRLLAEGDESIRRSGTIDGRTALKRRRLIRERNRAARK